MSASLRLHAIEPRSRANGPGARFALWVQGCTLGCPGCFNPDSHAGGGEPWEVERLMEAIVEEGAAIEGVTVSGGEPFEQPEGLLALVDALRRRTGLSILVFSGFTREEIERTPLGPAILARIDVLVDGRYQARARLGRGLRGSVNQRIQLLTERYTLAAIESTPEAEVVIGADGLVRVSGVQPLAVPGRRSGSRSGSGSDL